MQKPQLSIAYVSYAAELAKSKSRKARILAELAGVELADDAARLEEWRTKAGGGLLATGIGGPLTGHGVDVLVIDDPVKNRVEAESALHRERVWDWFNDVGFTRLEPRGSVVAVQTRWHPDDLAGRLIQTGKWEQLKLPALDSEGKALWPERWPAEELLRIKEQVGDYTWASLYQGEPRSRGGSVFGDATIYEKPPATYRVCIGLDLAYTAKTQAHYSVAVVLAEHEGSYYVLDVCRLQVQAQVFAERLKALAAKYARPRFHWYVSTTEQGIAQLMKAQGINVEARIAKADKFVRAQPVAAKWNAGKVLVPARAAWADAFMSELASFTGINDAHDDQVDALASAFDGLSTSGAERLRLLVSC